MERLDRVLVATDRNVCVGELPAGIFELRDALLLEQELGEPDWGRFSWGSLTRRRIPAMGRFRLCVSGEKPVSSSRS